MKILVVGKGGREHALIRALAESPGAHEMFSFPGSDAISELAEIVEVGSDVEELLAWMSAVGIDLCVAGEESYLVKDDGLANACERAGIPCWGPHKQSAQLEASKEFAKEFLQRHSIPTGGGSGVNTIEEAREVIGGKYPVVLKFDGLAAGKGVAVCMTEEEGEDFLKEVLVERRFGEGRMLVEEFLTGPEVSIFAAVVDGEYQIFTPARDYKRIGVGDEGPNTGGMGAVASRQLIPAELLERIEREIVRPTVSGLQSEGLPYRGFLYFGLMLTPDGPKVIEYNCRFGDPECQAVMPLVKGDLAGYCLAGAKGELDASKISFDEGWSVCAVAASAGYPEGSRSGDVISGLGDVGSARVYHAGTRKSASGEWETNGGRVLAVVAGGPDRQSAVAAAHGALDKISFDGLQRRRDVGILHFEEA
ncbi:phosphoribosylamine--glycine ligase [Haloferula sp.]|uniref:phosphoribosylamine--glycine ligase n=1 Tax=Haloferula sp. TaxID=2497595 RepID=UPI00329AB51E